MARLASARACQHQQRKHRQPTRASRRAAHLASEHPTRASKRAASTRRLCAHVACVSTSQHFSIVACPYVRVCSDGPSPARACSFPVHLPLETFRVRHCRPTPGLRLRPAHCQHASILRDCGTLLVAAGRPGTLLTKCAIICEATAWPHDVALACVRHAVALPHVLIISYPSWLCAAAARARRVHAHLCFSRACIRCWWERGGGGGVD